MHYVGVDAPQTSSHITIMDETGGILKRKQVPSSPTGLHQVLGRYQEPKKAVLEASYTWGPVYDWLDDLVGEAILAHPAKMKAIAYARIKTDTIDCAPRRANRQRVRDPPWQLPSSAR